MPSGITPQDYIIAEQYVTAIKAIAPIITGNIYIIDFYAQRFLYVSPGWLMLGAKKPEDVVDMGFEYYSTHMSRVETSMLARHARAFFGFLHRRQPEERGEYCASVNLHICNDGRSVLVNHKFAPLALDGGGRMWLGVCSVSLSGAAEAGNLIVRKRGQSSCWQYVDCADRWIEVVDAQLSGMEKEILLLAARGLSVSDISERVCRGVNTVKSRKKVIFGKLGVATMSQAVALALERGLL